MKDKVKKVKSNSLALELLTDYKIHNKRLVGIIITILIMWFLTIGYLVVQENQATRNMIMQNKIDALADQITILRGENSNLKQNEYLLSQLATTAPKPPCYYNCGCGSSLY